MIPPRKHPCPPDKTGPVDEAAQRFEGRGYKDMQDYVRARYGFEPKTCWIADRKEKLGFNPRVAPNRGRRYQLSGRL